MMQNNIKNPGHDRIGFNNKGKTPDFRAHIANNKLPTPDTAVTSITS